MTVNLGMLATYDYCKDLSIYVFGGTAKDLSTMAVASFLSGVFASVISLPSDNIKTKLMKMKKQADGTYPYRGFRDCMVKSIKREGVLGLWVGVGTYVVRISPHSVVVNVNLLLKIESYCHGLIKY